MARDTTEGGHQILPEPLAREQFCYLTTTGRVTGKPHEIEVWFGADGDTLYLLSGGGRRSDWVKNLAQNPRVKVRVGGQTFDGWGEIVEDGGQNLAARCLLGAKYQGWREGAPLSSWAREALLVAIHLEGGDEQSALR